jgi:hypothetical protein
MVYNNYYELLINDALNYHIEKFNTEMSRVTTKPTQWVYSGLRPAWIQTSLRIRAV